MNNPKSEVGSGAMDQIKAYREKLEKEIAEASETLGFRELEIFLRHCDDCQTCWPKDQYFGTAIRDNTLCDRGRALHQTHLDAAKDKLC